MVIQLNRIHNMFKSGDGADFTIECQKQQFFVHKFILAMHSEVFRVMFTHKSTIENLEGRVLLTDTAPIAVQQMLTFMWGLRSVLIFYAFANLGIAEVYLKGLKRAMHRHFLKLQVYNFMCILFSACTSKIIFEAFTRVGYRYRTDTEYRRNTEGSMPNHTENTVPKISDTEAYRSVLVTPPYIEKFQKGSNTCLGKYFVLQLN